MAGPLVTRLRERARARFPRITAAAEAIGSTVSAVVVGSAEARTADRSVEASLGVPFLAVLRKTVAAGVGALTAKIYAAINWDLAFLNAELTEWIVAIVVTTYLVWRFPNAAPPAK